LLVVFRRLRRSRVVYNVEKKERKSGFSIAFFDLFPFLTSSIKKCRRKKVFLWTLLRERPLLFDFDSRLGFSRGTFENTENNVVVLLKSTTEEEEQQQQQQPQLKRKNDFDDDNEHERWHEQNY